ncbi:hypothetical protein KC19_VG108000 [Ceratodon purpureus]|uniref:Uncharacterized protein n=1 Tax=Ceratodon purpureus TaxID=3225 RepID=A0A8T0HPR5_CERPU|nr:hypothetical protein KC19_VG108000 [Ceratodon purpureus]
MDMYEKPGFSTRFWSRNASDAYRDGGWSRLRGPCITEHNVAIEIRTPTTRDTTRCGLGDYRVEGKQIRRRSSDVQNHHHRQRLRLRMQTKVIKTSLSRGQGSKDKKHVHNQ